MLNTTIVKKIERDNIDNERTKNNIQIGKKN